MRRIEQALAAALAGAAGLGLETLLVSSAGLALGYGRSHALGIATFVAGWALGAALGGRRRRNHARAFGAIAALLALLAVPAAALLVVVGARLSGAWIAGALALATIASVALLQGALLPLLAQASAATSSRRERPISSLLAANLLGSVVGAYLVGDVAPAAWGRLGAAALAGVLALLAGVSGVLALRAENGVDEPAPARVTASPSSLRRAALVVGLTTAWLIGLQWIALRLAVLWLGGMQPALTAVLCASLASLALGAALLPPLVPRDARGTPIVIALCALGSTTLFAAGALGAALPPGNAAGLAHGSAFLHALALCGPALLAFGAIVPVVHRALGDGAGRSGERLGRLYLHEAWGALLGILLVHEIFVPAFGLGGALAASTGFGACALLCLAPATPRLASAALVVLLVVALLAARLPEPALASPPLANPALSIASFVEDRDFAVAVVDDGILGERTLLTDGFRAAGTGEDYRYMRVLGHLPVLLHPAPRRVAVLALGTGTTVGAVALHPEVERIYVLELSRAVVAAAPWFESKNRGVLAEGLPGLLHVDPPGERVVVELGDGRRTLARHARELDVITLEPLLPDSPFAVYLYTPEFYARAKSALAPGGIVCQWVPPHALAPATFDAVLDAFARSFAWSGVFLFGTQVILVGAESAPVLSAARFPRAPGDAPGGDDAPATDALGGALDDLGLATPGGLAARFVADGARLARVARPLTDRDPWVIYAGARAGAIRLADLPANLARLRTIASDPPGGWLDPDGARRLAGIRALHAAREAHARSEAELRGRSASDEVGEPRPDLARELARARELAAGDPELAQFEAELEFLASLRDGVAQLTLDRSSGGGAAALPGLVRAAELRGARADVHLYLATALERTGSAAAERALAAALARCPRLAETPEATRAAGLGLSADLWTRAARVPEPR